MQLGLLSSALILKELVLSAGQDSDRWRGRVAALVETGLRQGWAWPLGLLGLAGLGWLISRARWTWISQSLLILTPIVAVTAGQVLWRMLTLAPPSPLAPRVAHSPATSATGKGAPVVWIVFDELDERVAFAQRPAGLSLPALDAFRAEAVTFLNAQSPANATAISIPAMLSHLLERPGLRAGIAGWYLPYCRTYAPYLQQCRQWPMNRQMNSYGHGLLTVMKNQGRSLLETSLYSAFGQSLAIQAHIRTILEMEQAAARMAADPNLDLVFLHLPAPHPPFVYDPARRDLSARNQDARGYLANLQLADRLFATIRARLERDGLWANAHVLVTGDHGYRQATRLGYPPGDRFVPFLWKPAGRVPPRQIATPFETHHTAALVNRLLEGEAAESVLARYP